MLPSLIGIIASSGGAAVAGDYESIATVTVGSGGSSSVSFTSIPSTYKHLQIRVTAQLDSNDKDFLVRFNSDTGSNYSIHTLIGNGSTVSAGASTSATGMEFMYNYASGYATSSFMAGIFDILDYSDTNKYKTTRLLSGVDYNGSGSVDYRSGLWRSTSAISSISFTPFSTGSAIQYSSFALYGIKG